MEAPESRSQKSQQSKQGHLIQDYDERSSSSNSSNSDDENWYPGDGICPPEDQFQACRQASLHSWSQAAFRSDGASKPVDMHLQAFLGLLKHVPDFFHQPPENVALTGGKKSPLVLRSSLHIQTTDSPHCCQQWKPIDYLQCLGFPKPSVYKTIEEPVCSVTLATQELRPIYLTNIILAWSYILSFRWVEIMQSAGKDCAFLHTSGDSMTENFWEVVTQGRWIARVKRGQANSYSPWMLQGEAESHKKRYLNQHSRIACNFADIVYKQLRMGSIITKFIGCFQHSLRLLHFRWARKRNAGWICCYTTTCIAKYTQPKVTSTSNDFSAPKPL